MDIFGCRIHIQVHLVEAGIDWTDPNSALVKTNAEIKDITFTINDSIMLTGTRGWAETMHNVEYYSKKQLFNSCILLDDSFINDVNCLDLCQRHLSPKLWNVIKRLQFQSELTASPFSFWVISTRPHLSYSAELRSLSDQSQ